MDNITIGTVDVLNTLFVMGSLGLSREGAYATIVIVLPAYVFSLVTNLILIGTVASNRSLHEPMYILLCNLAFNDIIGISAMVPRTLFNIMFGNVFVTFPGCFLQACCLHVYGGANLLILSVMAFDRYVAICHPLRYHTIMSRATIMYLIVFTWGTTFVLLLILFHLTLQYPFCRKEMSNYFCDNVTILKLTCATDTTVNNIYGLFITGFFHATGVFSIVFSYTWILITCCKTNDSESRSKAWNTCATHLTVFVFYEISSSAVVLIHRFPETSPTLRKVMQLAYVIIPNCINPVIYGLKTKDFKSKLKIFRNKIFSMNDVKLYNTNRLKIISSF
ncbi:olfactory receptor 7G1-like [Hoplias malabaricus]|uniref:olfactory receptor 7G1-like n=1 Tax=Hoplias malabaricus TaxID=27720 RepID=UPI003461BB73